MNAMSLRLPRSMHEQVRAAANREGISINQYIMLAVAEKLVVQDTLDYLDRRARRGSKEKLLAVLAKAPDVVPDEEDRL